MWKQNMRDNNGKITHFSLFQVFFKNRRERPPDYKYSPKYAFIYTQLIILKQLVT